MKIFKQKRGLAPSGKRGITLVEVVVAMGIFSIIITLAVGGFISIIRLQQKAYIMRETQQNARLAMEMMSKDSRQSSAVSVPATHDSLSLSMPGSTVSYQLSGSILTRVYTPVSGTSITSNITSNSMAVNNLQFYSTGSLLTISFEAKETSANNIYEEASVQMETTVVLEGIPK